MDEKESREIKPIYMCFIPVFLPTDGLRNQPLLLQIQQHNKHSVSWIYVNDKHQRTFVFLQHSSECRKIILLYQLLLHPAFAWKPLLTSQFHLYKTQQLCGGHRVVALISRMLTSLSFITPCRGSVYSCGLVTDPCSWTSPFSSPTRKLLRCIPRYTSLCTEKEAGTLTCTSY